MLGRLAAHGVLPGAFEMVDRRADRQAGALEPPLLVLARDLEARRLRQDAVDLHRAAPAAEVAHVVPDLVREVPLAHEVEDGGARMRPGDHERSAHLLAALERDAGDAAVRD